MSGATKTLKQIISQGNCSGVFCGNCPMFNTTCDGGDPIDIFGYDSKVVEKATNMINEIFAEIIEGA